VDWGPGWFRHEGAPFAAAAALLLHAWGFSVQRPRRILARADVAAQDRWRRHIYPNLKKKPKRGTGR